MGGFVLTEGSDQATVALSVTGLSKRFGRKRVWTDLNLTVRDGEAVAVVGENGSGKTTLLRICAGLLAADSGSVRHRGRVGYCPQEPGLLDLLTSDEHLCYFGQPLGLSRVAAMAQGHALLSRLRYPLADRSLTRDLSGGTRQKLNLALALLGDPNVLLLDEPYQGFDQGVYVNFWELIDDWRRAGKAVLLATHLLADRGHVDRLVDLSAFSAVGEIEIGGEPK